MWRLPLALIICTLTLGPSTAAPPSAVVRAWLPIEPGDRWVYQHESLDAGEHGLADPIGERWKTEETIESVEDAPEGALVITRVRAYDHEMSSGWLPGNDAVRKLDPVERILIHRNCVYVKGDAYREADGEDTPSLCFPMAVGGTWGRSAATSPALEDVWHVRALNGDPFGAAGAQTFHAFAYEGSGTVHDVWYAKGIGMVQSIVEHHGTYNEDRTQLLTTTIAGQTRAYALVPARTVPLSELDCLGPGWQHFVHANGTAFVSPADCAAAVDRHPSTTR
jgi:hypothetical protein